MNRRPNGWRLLRWLAVAAAALLSLEIGLRCFLWIRGRPYDAAETRSEVSRGLEQHPVPASPSDRADPNEPAHELPAARCLHPYFGWETSRGRNETEECVRGRARDERDTIKILIVGGTLAEAFGYEASGSAAMLEFLRADPRFETRAVRFWHFGREGFKPPQPVNVLSYALGLGLVPDVVINIDGVDAVALGNENAAQGVHPVFPATKYWSHLAEWGTSSRRVVDSALDVRRSQRAIEAWARAIQRWHLERSALLGQAALLRLRSLQRDLESRATTNAKHLSKVATRRSLRGPTLEGGEHDAIEASVSAWFECSRCLHAICHARGILYIHVLHPALHDTGSKPLSAQEIERGRAPAPWTRGVELGYPSLRAKGAELVGLGVHFVDASTMFRDVTDEVYVDACRIGPGGMRALAERVGRELTQHWPPRR